MTLNITVKLHNDLFLSVVYLFDLLINMSIVFQLDTVAIFNHTSIILKLALDLRYWRAIYQMTAKTCPIFPNRVGGEVRHTPPPLVPLLNQHLVSLEDCTVAWLIAAASSVTWLTRC